MRTQRHYRRTQPIRSSTRQLCDRIPPENQHTATGTRQSRSDRPHWRPHETGSTWPEHRVYRPILVASTALPPPRCEPHPLVRNHRSAERTPNTSFSRVTPEDQIGSRSRPVAGGFDIRNLTPDIPQNHSEPTRDCRWPDSRIRHEATLTDGGVTARHRHRRCQRTTLAIRQRIFDNSLMLPGDSRGIDGHSRSRPGRDVERASRAAGLTDSYDLADRAASSGPPNPPFHVRRSHPSIEARSRSRSNVTAVSNSVNPGASIRHLLGGEFSL